MGWGYATCWKDHEPLVETFEFPGYEFICVVCGTKYEFLRPRPASETPELEARLAELKERYRTERAERVAAASRSADSTDVES